MSEIPQNYENFRPKAPEGLFTPEEQEELKGLDNLSISGEKMTREQKARQQKLATKKYDYEAVLTETELTGKRREQTVKNPERGEWGESDAQEIEELTTDFRIGLTMEEYAELKEIFALITRRNERQTSQELASLIREYYKISGRIQNAVNEFSDNAKLTDEGKKQVRDLYDLFAGYLENNPKTEEEEKNLQPSYT